MHKSNALTNDQMDKNRSTKVAVARVHCLQLIRFDFPNENENDRFAIEMKTQREQPIEFILSYLHNQSNWIG